MLKTFQRANLRGHCFEGQDLAGIDFSQADIRGANFSKANLAGANFQGVKTGIQPLWFFVLTLILILSTALTSLIISFASAVVITFLEGESPFDILLESSLSFGIAIFFIKLMEKRGLGATLGAWSIMLAAIIPTLAALAEYKTDPTMKYIIGSVVMRTVGLAGILAGAITGSIIIFTGLAISNRLILILIAGVALLVAPSGIIEGLIGFRNPEKVELLSWLFAIILTILVCLVTIYMGYSASRGDTKFSLIQSLAIFLLTLKGTQFQEADLTDSDFTNAKLSGANFRDANLTRTRWFQGRGLDLSLTKGTYLDNFSIRNLVISGQGQDQNFDYQDLRGLNLQGFNLNDASFIGTDLSNADLQDTNLSRTKLAQAQLYNTRMNRACLTGAYIQDWGISLNTQFEEVQCDYVYMHLPTSENPDPCRKPDNREEIFKPGDFADFITPIIKTLDLYKRQNVDPRIAAQTYKTLDLFHHQGIDPSAAAIALKRLAEKNPGLGLEVVALEGRGNDRIRLQARVSGEADPSQLSQEYFEQYGVIKDLNHGDLQSLLRGIEEKDNRIRSLENMVKTAIQQKTFYVETYQSVGDTMTEKSSFNINAGGNIGNLSGLVGGDVSGIMNLGTISGNVTNAIGKLPDNSEDKSELKTLLQQLQSVIEKESELSPEDKIEALEQVEILAEAGQKPEDEGIKKAAKTAIKILKGTTVGLSETTKLVEACATLLPAISALLLLC